MNRILSILICLYFGIFSNQVAFSNQDQVNPKSILFIGNSYLYYNDSLHNHFKRIVKEKNLNFDVGNIKSSTISGARLEHHNLDHLIKPMSIGSIEKFDLVILQGGSGESLTSENRNSFAKKVKEYIEKIKSADSKAALYMIPSYVKPHENYDPKLIRIIEDMYVKAGKRNNALVIPVGLAFENAYRKMPNINLHKPDGTHPNLLGTYLAACVVYASVYKESPIGILYDYFGSIRSEDRLFLQEIAHETVVEFISN